jgi:FkbM family methyltransferase
VVVDVGAHIGVFSIEASEKTNRVFSYELNPSTFEILQKNVEFHNAENVEIFNKGLSGKNEEKRIRGKDKSLMTSVEIEAGKSSDKVKLFSFQEEIEKILPELKNRTNLLKLDCEGSEFPILEKTSADTLQLFNTILIEYHENVGSASDLIHTLESKGFNAEEIEDKRDNQPENAGFIIAKL